jgi:hypothetical protein
MNELPEKDREMIEYIRDEHIKPYAEMEHYSELFVQIFDENGELLTEGTLDDLVISPDATQGSLKDWKFGSYEVAPADENLQIKAYVCGIFLKFPQVEKVYALIVQPVYDSADYDAQCVFEREDMPEMLAEIRMVIERGKNSTEADVNPTASNCRYCNKEKCKAFQNKMLTNFDLMTVDPDALSLPEQEMTVDFADRLLCAEKKITAAMKTKSAKAKEIILQAGGSDNFRIRAGRISKRTDWKGLARDKGISAEEIAEYTSESEGKPFVTTRMRRKKNTNLLEG